MNVFEVSRSTANNLKVGYSKIGNKTQAQIDYVFFEEGTNNPIDLKKFFGSINNTDIVIKSFDLVNNSNVAITFFFIKVNPDSHITFNDIPEVGIKLNVGQRHTMSVTLNSPYDKYGELEEIYKVLPVAIMERG